MIVTQERLRELLYYNCITGIFTWKLKTGRVTLGSIAGHSSKYTRIRIDNRMYLAHRLAFLYMTGEWPKGDVDHIDGNTLNNCISNLRDVTKRENLSNQKRHRAGCLVGATFHKGAGKWRANIKVNGNKIYLGCYDTAEEAHEEYIKALNGLNEGDK